MEEMGTTSGGPVGEFSEMARASAIHDRSGPQQGPFMSALRSEVHGEEQDENLLFPELRPDSGSEAKITAKALLMLIEDQHYRCALSGVPLDPENAAIDHIIPVSRGGSHDMTNLQVLHENVNVSKRNMMPEEFIEMCVNVAKHAGRL